MRREGFSRKLGSRPRRTVAAGGNARPGALLRAWARAGCTAEVLDVWKWGGKIFAQELIDSVRETSLALGYRTQDILSQAGHDAYFVARHAPTTMIFSPCKGGITHNNQELCTPDDLEPGLNVLLHAVVARADR